MARARRVVGAGLVAVGLLTSGVGAVAPSARADDRGAATVVPVSSGNPTCGHLAGSYGAGQPWSEIKVDPPQSGAYGPNGEITVTMKGNSLDWTSTVGIDAVFVKAGNTKHNLYLYEPDGPEAVHDEGLVPQTGPGNGISHISFCHDLDYGHIEVLKLVSDALGEEGVTFEFVADCDGTDPVPFALGHGGAWHGPPLAVGTRCTVTESDDPLAVPPWMTTHQVADGEEISGHEVAVTVAKGTTRVTFRNTRLDESEAETARLVVTKHVADEAGDGTDTFGFWVLCGYPDDDDAADHNWSWFALADDFELADGDSWVAPPLPIGVWCYVEELVSEDWSPVYSVDGADAQPGSAAFFTVHADLNSVDFTNSRQPDMGTVTVVKLVADDVPGEDAFEFAVLCGDDQFEPFTLSHEESWTSEPLRAGTQCTVAETEDDQAVPAWETTHEIDSDGVERDGTTAELTVPDGSTSVVFRNSRRVVTPEPETAGLVVTKDVAGSAHDDTGTFTFHLVCDDATDLRFELGDGGTWPGEGDNEGVNDLPVGTTCSISETPDSAWDTTFSVDGGDPASGNAATVVIGEAGNVVAFANAPRARTQGDPGGTAPLLTGPLTVNKAVVGVDGGDLDRYTFHFDVDCTGDAFDGSLDIVGQGSHVYHAALPGGTTCTVTEGPVAARVEGESWETAVTDDDGAPDGTVTIADGAGRAVAFTNTRTVVGATIAGAPSAAVTFVPTTAPGPEPTTLPRTGADFRWFLVAAGLTLVAGGALLASSEVAPARLERRRRRHAA